MKSACVAAALAWAQEHAEGAVAEIAEEAEVEAAEPLAEQ